MTTLQIIILGLIVICVLIGLAGALVCISAPDSDRPPEPKRGEPGDRDYP